MYLLASIAYWFGVGIFWLVIAAGLMVAARLFGGF